MVIHHAEMHRIARTLVMGAAVAAVAGCASSGTGASSEAQIATTDVRPVKVMDADGNVTSIDITHNQAASAVTVRVPVTAAWINAQGAYARLGIPLSLKADSLLKLGNEGINIRHPIDGKRLSDMLHCGIGPAGENADAYGAHLNIVTHLMPVTDSTTSVMTLVQAQSVPTTFGTPPVPCMSTGALERRILTLITEP